MPPARSLPYEFALAPDGRHIVFVAPAGRRRLLWLRSLDNETITPLPGTEDADYPFWSADSTSIGYFASGTLRRIDIAGGPSITLARAPFRRGGSWNGDGTIVFSPTGEGLVQISAGGGEPVAITRLNPPAETGHWWPQFLPDGRHFLFFVNGTQAGVYLGSVDGEMPRRLMKSDTAAAYLPPDMIVFARQRVLVARHFNTRTYEVSGPERVIAEAVGADATFRLGGFSVSADGRIAYQGPQALPVELAAFDRLGRPLGVLIGNRDGDQVANPDLSPKDLRVAVTLRVNNNVDIWLRDLQGGALTRLTTDDDADAFPVWSPDARLIAFTANRTRRIHVTPSSGLGREEQLLDDAPASPEDWSRDNRYLLYRTFDQKTGRDLWALDRFAKPPARLPVATSSFDERNGQFSPDGRWVAYETNRSGPSEVIVQSFPDGARVLPVSRAGGTQPRWSADQQEIYFVAPGGNLMAASVSTTRDQSLQFGVPVTLFTTRLGEGAAVFRPQYDVTPDGRFLIAQTAEQSVSPLKLLLNWKPRP